jgi:integrase
VITAETINSFLSSLNCSTGGKHAYYRGIEVFVNYLFKNGFIKVHPLLKIESSKPSRPILPSLTLGQVQYLIESADILRDKCIISLFADSGMRLGELSSMRVNDIDWRNNTIQIWGKGNIQRRAVFTERTATLLKDWLSTHNDNGTVWDIDYRGIQCMLRRLEEKTGLKCNPHTFRRTFASNLHRAGMDIEHIMRLGGWSSLDMVLTYTKSVKFEDSLKLYQKLEM